MIRQFRSLSGRARFSVVALWVTIGFEVITVISASMGISLLQRAQAGLSVSFQEIELYERRESIVAFGFLAVYFTSGIAFLSWVGRSYNNLSALGVLGLRFSPGWVIGWWFIPFMNLLRPYQVMKEIWLRTFGDTIRKPTRILGWWWGLLLVSGGLGRAAARTTDSLESALGASWMSVLSSMISIPAALLAIRILSDITEFQERRARGEILMEEKEYEPEDPDAKWQCPECEHENENSTFTCANCGYRLV